MKANNSNTNFYALYDITDIIEEEYICGFCGKKYDLLDMGEGGSVGFCCSDCEDKCIEEMYGEGELCF